jgi:predicted transcriptional regulator
MSTAKTITAEDCVLALKARKTAHTASDIAGDLGSTSRAVATALRMPVKDGRISARFTKEGVMYYRFVRLKAKVRP